MKGTHLLPLLILGSCVAPAAVNREAASADPVAAAESGAPDLTPDPHLPWSAERAGHWYSLQPWLVGCNFLPSTASNQLELWQADTWDPSPSSGSSAGRRAWA